MSDSSETTGSGNTSGWTPEEVQAEFSPSILCGLRNIGNTCYFNSGIQCLLNVGELVSALRWCGNQSKRQKEANALLIRRPSSALTFYNHFVTLMNEMDKPGGLQAEPRGLVAELARVNPQFEGFHQQDCPEMVHSALGAIEDATALDMNTEVVLQKSNLGTGDHPCEAKLSLPVDSSSRHFCEVLHLMHRVNSENQRLEPGSYVPPRLVRSAPFDVFKGYLLNETTCNRCHYTSRVVEAFSTLSIAIPTYKQRVAYAKLHPPQRSENTPPKKVSWNPFRLICMCLASLLRVCGCFSASGSEELGELTVHECLSIHFSPTELKGANRYKCLVCKSKEEATHRTRVLSLPDTLTIHLKRFEYGHYWTSKKTDYVSFPGHWDPQLSHGGTGENDVASPLSPMALSCTRTDCGASLNGAGVPGLDSPSGEVLDLDAFCHTEPLLAKPPHTMYSLSGVVNHHGSFFGGHYTAYCHKGTEGWVLFNDHRVARAEAEEVHRSQGYLFFYKKQPLVAEAPELQEMRHRAKEYLIQAVGAKTRTPRDEADDGETMFVSRLWLHRLATHVDPGPILNDWCYCDAANADRCLFKGDSVPLSEVPAENQSRHFHASVEWLYVPVNRTDWLRFVSHFGGGPTVGEAEFADHMKRERRWLAALTKNSFNAAALDGSLTSRKKSD